MMFESRFDFRLLPRSSFSRFPAENLSSFLENFTGGGFPYRRFGQVDAIFAGKLSSWPELDCTVPAAIVRKLARSAWSRTRINPLEPAH